MKILITGSKGFIGKHLSLSLERRGHKIIGFTRDNNIEDLRRFIQESDFIVHLAGVMRPIDNIEFYESNYDLTENLVKILIEEHKDTPIIFSSSTQTSMNNDYGVSKLMAETTLLNLQKVNGNKVYIFRLSNAFGIWGKPNYNSVVATFCYNISHNLDIRIDDPDKIINFIYIDDIVKTFSDIIDGKIVAKTSDFNIIKPFYPTSIGSLAFYLRSFHNDLSHVVFEEEMEFCKKLFDTFVSFYDYKNLLVPVSKTQNYFSLPNDYGTVKIFGLEKLSTTSFDDNIFTTRKIAILKGECLIQLNRLYDSFKTEYLLKEENLNLLIVPAGHTVEIQAKTDAQIVCWENTPIK